MKIYSSTSIIILAIIILLASVVRLYRLGEIPVGFHRDEAFLGYNGYSLLKTGRDMTGNKLPINIESFLYSPGGYSYASIPFISLFGLSAFSIRLTSAFFGILTIPLVFLFVNIMFKTLKQRQTFGLLSAGILAITPWHINLSRTATENVLIVFLITLGSLLFIFFYQQTKQSKFTYLFYFIAFFCFSTCLTIYQAPRAFLPLFVPILCFYGWIQYKNIKTTLAGLFLMVITIIIPVSLILLSPTLSTRMKTVSIFSTEETKLIVEEQIRGDGVMNVPIILSRIMHNKLIGYSNVFIQNFFSHISFPFLFTDQGLPARYRIPQSGLLYLSFLPLFFLGVIFLWKHQKHELLLFLSWIVCALIGSSLTFDDIPNLQRTLIVFPPLAIIIAAGFLQIFTVKRFKFFILLIFTLGIAIEGSRYVYHYYIQQQIYRPWFRQEGYKQLVEEINTIKSQFKNIVITNSESSPSIFFLFFNSYNPHTYIQEATSKPFSDYDRTNFDKYIFSTTDCPFKEETSVDLRTNKETILCNSEPNTLYVNAGSCKLPTHCGKVLQQIKRKDLTTVFTIVEASPSGTIIK